MGRHGSATVARSHRPRRYAANQLKTLPRTNGSRCPKQQNEGRSKKSWPTAAKQTKNRRQKKAVAVVVGMRKEEETKLRYILVKY
jgi:hypothetical protein